MIIPDLVNHFASRMGKHIFDSKKDKIQIPVPPLPNFNQRWAIDFFPEGGSVDTSPDGSTRAEFYIGNQQSFHIEDRPFLAIADNKAIVGMAFHHFDAKTGERCEVDIPFLSDKPTRQERDKETWIVGTIAPQLTVHPSIVCKICGLHGFLTSGTWEDLADKSVVDKYMPKEEPRATEIEAKQILANDPRYFE